MYVLPFIVVLLIALAIFFSPLLAVVLVVVALFGLGGVKYFGGSAVDSENRPSEVPQAGAAGSAEVEERESEGGIWGETWPEEREGQERRS
jgi:hypothetical protein